MNQKFELVIFKCILSSLEVVSNLKIVIKTSITKLKKTILLCEIQAPLERGECFAPHPHSLLVKMRCFK